jgi:hypothetical protein
VITAVILAASASASYAANQTVTIHDSSHGFGLLLSKRAKALSMEVA